MKVNLLDCTSFTASLLRLERNRWYSLSLGSRPLSVHQSAAALCQPRSVSTSALCTYHLRVSGFMLILPLVSNGTSGGASLGKSDL